MFGSCNIKVAYKRRERNGRDPVSLTVAPVTRFPAKVHRWWYSNLSCYLSTCTKLMESLEHLLSRSLRPHRRYSELQPLWFQRWGTKIYGFFSNCSEMRELGFVLEHIQWRSLLKSFNFPGKVYSMELHYEFLTHL